MRTPGTNAPLSSQFVASERYIPIRVWCPCKLKEAALLDGERLLEQHQRGQMAGSLNSSAYD